MANTISSAHNPIFYVQEGLIALRKKLGMAGRVYRGLDDSQTSREKGQTLTMKVPGSFVAQDAPSVAQDLSTSSLSMSLDHHKEVKIALTDKELAYTSRQIIAEHIEPMAYALADKIDQMLCALAIDVPWISDWSSPAAVTDITTTRAGMLDNLVDVSNPEKLHFMVSPTIEGELLALSAFSQHQGAGDAGVAAQMRGYLGTRFGFNFFSNQNAPNLTSATIADVAGAINKAAGYAAGVRTIDFDGVTAAAAFKAGDTLVISGHTQRYVLTADFTADGGGAVAGATIYGSPFVQGGGLESAVLDNAVVTVTLNSGSGATKRVSLAFHEQAFAAGFARLPDFYNGEGVRVFSVLDPVTKLGLRARSWVDPNNSKYYIAFDTLFGLKTIDGNKAWRVRD